MQILKNYRSSNFKNERIPVEFVVLHYTAQSLKESLNIFLSSKSMVSCHLLMDRDGSTYELVDCWDGQAKKAFHAGQSLWQDSENKKWESFNDFSIGIELVNWNGNIFPFTEQQYQSLFKILAHLKSQFPQLKNPHRILGHEDIAGFRGKKDPGHLFDWSYLFKNVYGDGSLKSMEEKNQIATDGDELNESSLESMEDKNQTTKDGVKIKNSNLESLDKKNQTTTDGNELNESSLDSTKEKNQPSSLSGSDHLETNSLKAGTESFPSRSSVLTKRQINSLSFLRKPKQWNDEKAKKISLILESNRYPFWLKKWFLLRRNL